MLAHPDTVFGLGDGGAHVGLISDASFPTYCLSHWARDRAHGRMEVGRVVEQLTSATARAVGLADRGVLAEGMRADLNVIDFDHLRLRGAGHGLRPARPGGKRLLQGARGYRATVVAGEVTYRDGEPTGALPGRLVRAARTAGAGWSREHRHTRGADMNASTARAGAGGRVAGRRRRRPGGRGRCA